MINIILFQQTAFAVRSFYDDNDDYEDDGDEEDGFSTNSPSPPSTSPTPPSSSPPPLLSPPSPLLSPRPPSSSSRRRRALPFIAIPSQSSDNQTTSLDRTLERLTARDASAIHERDTPQQQRQSAMGSAQHVPLVAICMLARVCCDVYSSVVSK